MSRAGKRDEPEHSDPAERQQTRDQRNEAGTNDSDAMAAAPARHRAIVQRMTAGGPMIFMMAACDSVEQKRAAWRGRSNKKNNLRKDGFGRIEIERIRRDAVIKFVLDFGLCVRPVGRPLNFKEARKAFEVWAREMVEDRSRVKLKSLLSKLPADFINATEGDS